MKGLPIGIQTLSKIVKNNYVYIDKTPLVYKLITNPLYYFLSRPRRFGKSLLLNTIEEVFKGNRTLFKGLWIEDKIEWETYPIIRLSFDLMNTHEGMFAESLANSLLRIAEEEGISISNSTNFKEIIEILVENLSKKTGKGVVILIDEYDRPLLDHLGSPLAETNREILRDLFTSLKGLDAHIHFTFITGISKFSQVSLFSSANNLTDITLNPIYSTICGYTQAELEESFSKYIPLLSQKANQSDENILAKMKYWYNGYSWNGEAVYNPFSVLRFFDMQQFGNYWFETGSPRFLVKILFEKNQYKFDHTSASYNLLATGFDINQIDPAVLMFQSGYLTIKNFDESTLEYELDFPNQEVKESLNQYLLQAYTSDKSGIQNVAKKIYKTLIDNDLEEFISLSNTLFSYIPEPIFVAKYEAYYQSILYLVFSLMGIETQAESPTNRGRIDGVVPTPDRIFILEYKIGKGADVALQQIKDNKYYQKYENQGKEIVLLGLALGEKERGIIDMKMEVLEK
jgi:Predicted AAA-ATPase/PD-(D/E)XK nuclease superfamily